MLFAFYFSTFSEMTQYWDRCSGTYTSINRGGFV